MSESLLKLQIEKYANQPKEQKSEDGGISSDKDGGGNAGFSSAASVSDSSQDVKSVSTNSGTLKIDATCSDAEVRYPTDLDLLHDGFTVPFLVTSREVAAEQRCEDVAVTESEESAARPEASVDDITHAGIVECLENWK